VLVPISSAPDGPLRIPGQLGRSSARSHREISQRTPAHHAAALGGDQPITAANRAYLTPLPNAEMHRPCASLACAGNRFDGRDDFCPACASVDNDRPCIPILDRCRAPIQPPPPALGTDYLRGPGFAVTLDASPPTYSPASEQQPVIQPMMEVKHSPADPAYARGSLIISPGVW